MIYKGEEMMGPAHLAAAEARDSWETRATTAERELSELQETHREALEYEEEIAGERQDYLDALEVIEEWMEDNQSRRGAEARTYPGRFAEEVVAKFDKFTAALDAAVSNLGDLTVAVTRISERVEEATND